MNVSGTVCQCDVCGRTNGVGFRRARMSGRRSTWQQALPFSEPHGTVCPLHREDIIETGLPSAYC